MSLQKSGLHPCFIHLNSDVQRFSQKVENGVLHWYIPIPKQKYKDDEKHDRLYLQNVVFFLRQYIKQTDHLVFHLNYSQCKHFTDELKVSFNCKIVLVVHYFAWCLDIMGNVSQLQNIIDKPDDELNPLGKQVNKSFNDEKNMLRSVDKVISLSKHTTKLLQKVYDVKKQNISTIYNGLGDKAKIHNDKELIRMKYNLPIEVPVIMFVGRLDSGKGLSYFIQASKIVLEQYPNCHIIIAGSGDYQTCMKECGNKWMNIHFTGWIEKTELYELYEITDIGVIPSFSEQCNYVAIEMMMHGLSMITTLVSGLAEMTENGISSLQVPVIAQSDKVEIDSYLLAEKILYLLQHPEERKRLGINARKRYETVYSAEIFRQNMLQFYQSLFYPSAL